jgi:anti-sigma factor ChrR (cupin superfamily)
MLAQVRIAGLDIDTNTDGVTWRSTTFAGVSWCDLRSSSPPQSRDAVALIRMEPGSGYPPHEHVGIEDVLVLSGGYRDELGVHEAGSYVRYAAGSSHAPIALGDASRPVSRANPACILFAVAREGVAPLDDREAPRRDVISRSPDARTAARTETEVEGRSP